MLLLKVLSDKNNNTISKFCQILKQKTEVVSLEPVESFIIFSPSLGIISELMLVLSLQAEREKISIAVKTTCNISLHFQDYSNIPSEKP